MIPKPLKLQPLALGDVMVALINQQKTVDSTNYYKELLGGNWTLEYANEQQEATIELPQFTKQSMTEEQILDYHIKNKTRDTNQYAFILSKVNQLIKQALADSSQKIKESESTILELMHTLSEACRAISVQRNYILSCSNKVKKSYSKIGPTLRKISNLKKVLQITKIWGQAKLPYLLSIDTSRPFLYDLKEIFQMFLAAEATIKNTVLSSSIEKVLATLESKKKTLIESVRQNFEDSIIRFTSMSEYRAKYEQYVFIRDQGLCSDVMCSEGIKRTIDMNAQSMYYEILRKVTSMANVDMLNESKYLDFFDEIIEQFVIYFRSWHYVTTFHLQNQTPYGRLFLESRRQVYLRLTAQIASSIQNSNKFISLEYKIKLQLVQKLQDYIVAGDKWMGKYDQITLAKAVTIKLKKQLQNIFSFYNNLIKNTLTQQLSVQALESVDSVEAPPAVKIIQDVSEIDYSKICAFLMSSDGQGVRIPVIENKQLPSPPKVRLKMGAMFIEMIAEYLERSKYLQSDKNIYINKITDHFQFILFMLYQVCVRDRIKEMINQDIQAKVAELEREEEPALRKIGEVTKLETNRRKYWELIQFMNGIGSKFDGVKIAGIIDVNKVFDSNSSDIINGFTKLVVRVANDLYLILSWLIEALPNSNLKGSRRCGQIPRLVKILKMIFSLVLDNNMEALSRKYIENLTNIMGKLKWEIKKFNQETAMAYKQYKMKALEIFRNNTLLFVVRSEANGFADIVEDKEVEVLYRSLLESYGRIEKINDNGRQLIRMDSIEITKILNEIGVNCDSWATWFEKYIEFTSERSYKVILEKAAKVGILYPPTCWKYPLMWVTSDISSREKKQYNNQLIRIYMQYLQDSILVV